MQKTPTLRPGQQRPRLSELLRRRGQSLSDYANESNLSTDDQVQMHCLMLGVEKDISLPKPEKAKAPTKALEKKEQKELEEPTEKPAKLKNALKDLAKQEVKKMSPSEGE